MHFLYNHYRANYALSMCVLQSCSGSVLLEMARFKASSHYSYGDQVNHYTRQLDYTFEFCDLNQ